MADLAKAYVQIIPSAQGMGKKLSEELDDAAGKAGDSAGKKLGSSLSAGLKTLGTAATAAFAGAAAGIGALAKSALDAYANFEQLKGGVETLFGAGGKTVEQYAQSVGKSVDEVRGEYDSLTRAQDTVLRNAQNAYKTAGMSANEYMETVTGFSASLLQSLGGDSQKAAEVADMALTDMADNANKMGTSMESIQLAYQGFAKQNYTMLDNLKLGYGGTQEEMKRLLADAEKLSGVHYDISNLSDVYNAIHVIQENMGIAGTTAEEAAHTISGSLAMTKAAFKNLVTGFGQDEADIETLVSNLADSLDAAIQNIVPRLGAILGGIAGAIPKILPVLMEQVREMLADMLPQLIEAAKELLVALTNALPQFLGLIADAAIQLVAALAQGIRECLPTLIPAVIELVMQIANSLMENLPLLLDAALQIIVALAQGLIDALPSLVERIPEIITATVDALLECLPMIVEAGVQLLTSLVAAMPDILDAIVGALPQIIDGITTALLENVTPIIIAGVQLLTAIVSDIPQISFEIVKRIPEIVAAIAGAFRNGLGELKECGKDLIRGLWNGIKESGKELANNVKNFFKDNVLGSVKKIFGIASPSKEFAWIGDMMVQGLAGGINENAKTAVQATRDMADGIAAVSFDAGAADAATIQRDVVYNTAQLPSYDYATEKPAETEDRFSLLLSLLSEYLPLCASRQVAIPISTLDDALGANTKRRVTAF